jgi:sugar phosphate isomerase/epimerase
VTDTHTLPGLGKINWDNVCHALADIDYKGVFTYEANGFLNRLVPEQYPAAIKLMVDTARYLTAKIENYKSEK